MQFIRPFYILSISLIFFACDSKPPAETEEDHHHDELEETSSVSLTAAQFENAGIVVGKVEQRQISGTITVNGVLDVPPQQQVTISVPLGGFLKNTSLLEGSRVKKGQLIAIIENLEFIQIQQDYLEAKSQLEQATSDYERQQALAKENVNSQKTLQQASTNFSTWRARVNGLREKLAMININVSSLAGGDIKSTINLYAPIDGYVTEVKGNIGKFLNPSDVLFEIVDTEHLHAELIVFEKDIPKLKIGQKVRFTLANETSERTATVYLIGRSISKDRTIQIHCHIDKEDMEMLPGMYLSAVVETEGALTAALPEEAIIDYQNRKYIFLVSEGEDETGNNENERASNFEMMEVEIGNTGAAYAEVNLPEGFDIQSKIVVKGAYALLSKLKNNEEAGEHAH
jgi:cobalt-zinc-cadmium efflux system membrane fusion protein